MHKQSENQITTISIQTPSTQFQFKITTATSKSENQITRTHITNQITTVSIQTPSTQFQFKIPTATSKSENHITRNSQSRPCIRHRPPAQSRPAASVNLVTNSGERMPSLLPERQASQQTKSKLPRVLKLMKSASKSPFLAPVTTPGNLSVNHAVARTPTSIEEEDRSSLAFAPRFLVLHLRWLVADSQKKLQRSCVRATLQSIFPQNLDTWRYAIGSAYRNEKMYGQTWIRGMDPA